MKTSSILRGTGSLNGRSHVLRRCILIGDNIREADHAARSQGWVRRGTEMWVDEVGQQIIFVASLDKIRGFSRDTVIYLAPGWYNVANAIELRAWFDQKDLECL